MKIIRFAIALFAASSVSTAQVPPSHVPVKVVGVNLVAFQSSNGKRFMMTIDDAEQNSIWASKKWVGMGVQAFVFAQQAIGTQPLYRYLNPKSGDHFFTTNKSEGDNSVASYGYVSENTCCYVSMTQGTDTVPLYRLLKGSYHWYAAGEYALNALVERGFHLEGVEGYVWVALKNGATPPTGIE